MIMNAPLKVKGKVPRGALLESGEIIQKKGIMGGFQWKRVPWRWLWYLGLLLLSLSLYDL